MPLVGCSKVEVSAEMDKLSDWIYESEVKDYKYEILNTYEEYKSNLNYSVLHNYKEDYFESNTLILIYMSIVAVLNGEL